jgi:hypothetical protein
VGRSDSEVGSATPATSTKGGSQKKAAKKVATKIEESSSDDDLFKGRFAKIAPGAATVKKTTSTAELKKVPKTEGAKSAVSNEVHNLYRKHATNILDKDDLNLALRILDAEKVTSSSPGMKHCTTIVYSCFHSAVC